MEEQMMDLVYFGYDYSDVSVENKKIEQTFIKQIKESFPNVILKDAYDNIKGFRQEVHLPKTEKLNYFSWLIGKMFYELSLDFQLIMMSASHEPEQKSFFEDAVKLAKKQYPEVFKPESLHT